eukprot:COSAG04_NODE_2245_length_4460_cov_16.902775_3_plen_353_part_00
MYYLARARGHQHLRFVLRGAVDSVHSRSSEFGSNFRFGTCCVRAAQRGRLPARADLTWRATNALRRAQEGWLPPKISRRSCGRNSPPPSPLPTPATAHQPPHRTPSHPRPGHPTPGAPAYSMAGTGRLQKLHAQLSCASGATTAGSAAGGGSLKPGLLSTMGIPYTDSGQQRHTLDVYHAAGGPAAPSGSQLKPVLFYIHGGGWERGDSLMVEGDSWFADPRFGDLAKETADASGGHPWGKPGYFVSELGFVFVSTNYRMLYPSTGHNEFWEKRNPRTSTETVRIGDMAEDCAKAMRWVHDHASDFGGDGSQIVVMGHSAGAAAGWGVCVTHRLTFSSSVNQQRWGQMPLGP